MKCSNCGHENRAGVDFCEECGQTLPKPAPVPTAKKRKAQAKTRQSSASAAIRIACPGCGYANRAGIRFCEECGTVLTVDPNTFAGYRQPGRQIASHSDWGKLLLRFLTSGVFGYLAGRLGILAINYLLDLAQ